jgi:phasin
LRALDTTGGHGREPAASLVIVAMCLADIMPQSTGGGKRQHDPERIMLKSSPLGTTGSGTMSDEVRDRFEIPKEMRSMAEASFEQARKTLDKFLTNAQATAGSIEERGATMRAGAKDIGAKAVAYAETNVQSSLDYAEKLLHAKDLPEVMRLHSEYVQGQMRSLAEQASEMGQIVGRAAMDAARPKDHEG